MARNPQHVLDACIKVLDVQLPELLDQDKSTRKVTARRMTVGALRELSQSTYCEIANLLGKRHHSSIIAMYRNFKHLARVEQVGFLKRVANLIDSNRCPYCKRKW